MFVGVVWYMLYVKCLGGGGGGGGGGVVWYLTNYWFGICYMLNVCVYCVVCYMLNVCGCCPVKAYAVVVSRLVFTVAIGVRIPGQGGKI